MLDLGGLLRTHSGELPFGIVDAQTNTNSVDERFVVLVIDDLPERFVGFQVGAC
jgi:hypothetical protein